MSRENSKSESLERQFAFIDESGTPHFDSGRAELGYVVVSALIPEHDLSAARSLVPRRGDGTLIKSSEQDATDLLASHFIQSLFSETRAQIGLVTAAVSDQGNADRMLRMRNGIESSPIKRRARASSTDAIRLQAAFSAISLSLEGAKWGGSNHHFEIVFDRGSESLGFMQKARAFMCSRRPGAPIVIDDVRWSSRNDEPLIMVSDWIAGSIRRDFEKDDQVLSRQVLAHAKAQGRLHDKSGFTAYLPIEPAQS